MAITVLLVLVVLWAAVLIPPVLRSRSESRRNDSLGFPLKMSSGGRAPLGPVPLRSAGKSRSTFGFASSGFRGSPTSAPGQPAAGLGTGMSPVQKRRRDVLVVVLGVAVLTLLLALLSGSAIFWLVHVVADLLLGTYLYLLVQLKHSRQQRAELADRARAFQGAPLPSSQRVSA